ncbi:hypothetical protein HJB79_21700 [Rhizobium lentis]|uniref:hypothetical protein n=1 Tax=Rhizobium lentis TaxID=1138194 RepID=UPI001C828D42|nr:hypothetical protein [Rhizobium lentis]MBX5141357.1 hypothetical protein [Rhizobium lentis]
MSIRAPDFAQKLFYAAALTSLFATSSLAQEASATPPPAPPVVELRQESLVSIYRYAARIAANHDVDVRVQDGGRCRIDTGPPVTIGGHRAGLVPKIALAKNQSRKVDGEFHENGRL